MEGKTIKASAGNIIFSEGDTGDAMYVVVRGLMQVYRDTSGGRVVLGKIEAGEFFGEMALIGKTARTATVAALRDSTLAVYKPDELESLLASKPEVGARMIRRLVERLRETSDKLAEERGKRLGAW
jgi:CRP-like cAMP-binding protein